MSDDATERESVIAGEMGDVLSRAPLGPGDDFLRCGGDSLQVVELVARLVDRFQPGRAETAAALRSDLLLAVFDDATPRALAAVVASSAAHPGKAE